MGGRLLVTDEQQKLLNDYQQEVEKCWIYTGNGCVGCVEGRKGLKNFEGGLK